MRSLASVIGLMVGMSVLAPVFAESAPVYDADSMQQQFDGNQASSADQDLPMPPAPGQEGTFVPTASAAPAATIADNNEVTSPPADAGASMSTSQRLKRVEQQVNTLQNHGAVARVEALQTEIQTLRGQVEQLTHQLQQLQAQQKSMYSDLDKRVGQKAGSDIVNAPIEADASLAKSVSKTVAKTPANVATTIAAEPKKEKAADKSVVAEVEKPAQPNVAEEQQIYQTAYDLIKAKKYNEAVDALQGMLKKYPSGQFAANAHYWLGELYGLMGKSDPALKEFNIVVKSYPNSPRISDAQLKVGLIYASQSKWSDAKDAFKKVINHFPGTASSRLAAEQLKQIKQAGN